MKLGKERKVKGRLQEGVDPVGMECARSFPSFSSLLILFLLLGFVPATEQVHIQGDWLRNRG